MHKFWNTQEAAAELGVDRSTIARIVKRGELIPAAKGPGRTGAHLFNPEDVLAYGRGERPLPEQEASK